MYSALSSIHERLLLRTSRFTALGGDGDAFTYRAFGDGGASDPDGGAAPGKPAVAVTGMIESRRRRVITAAAILSLLAASPLVAPVLLASPVAAALLAVPVLAIAGLLVYTYLSRNGRFILLTYRRDGEALSPHHELTARLLALTEFGSLWHRKPVGKGGAPGGPMERSPAVITLETPYFILANIDVCCLRFGETGLYFFPDFLLLRRRGRYRGIPYGALGLDYAEGPVAEPGPLPRGARVLGYTWLYRTARGGPDRRFRKNPKIPAALYGKFTVTLPGGVEIKLLASDWAGARLLASSLGARTRAYNERLYAEREKRKRDARPRKERGAGGTGRDETRYWREREKAKPRGSGARGPGAGERPAGASAESERAGRGGDEAKRRPKEERPDLRARRVLGVSPNAGRDEIKRAYRKLAKRYHPDRLGALEESEIRKAEEKIKEINRAYDELERLAGRK